MHHIRLLVLISVALLIAAAADISANYEPSVQLTLVSEAPLPVHEMYYIIVNPERVYLPNDYISQEILNEQDYIIVTAQITEASQNVAEVELKPFFSHVFQVPIDDDELLEFYYHAFCPKSYCNQVRLIVKAKHFIVSDD